MDKIICHIKNRENVKKHLEVMEKIGAKSIYLFGNDYGYVLNGTQFQGSIKD